MNLEQFAVSFFLDPERQSNGDTPDGMLFVYAPSVYGAQAVFKARMPAAFIDGIVAIERDTPVAASMPAKVPAVPVAATAAPVPAVDASSVFAGLLGRSAAITPTLRSDPPPAEDIAWQRAQSDDARLVPDWAKGPSPSTVAQVKAGQLPLSALVPASMPSKPVAARSVAVPVRVSPVASAARKARNAAF